MRFDGYWRAARDVRVHWDVDPSSTNDFMKGLEWLGRTLPSGSELFFFIYQSILQGGASSVKECPPVLERMSPGSANFLVQVLGDVRYQNNPIFDNRDIIQLLSLEHLRRDRDPQVEPALRNHALELNIRIINSIDSLPEALIVTKRVTTVACISLVNILHAGQGNWAKGALLPENSRLSVFEPALPSPTRYHRPIATPEHVPCVPRALRSVLLPAYAFSTYGSASRTRSHSRTSPALPPRRM